MNKVVVWKRGMSIALLAGACVTSALAQSTSTMDADNEWNFGVDPNTFQSYLGVTDLGEQVYNLTNSSASPYTSATGTGATTASVYTFDGSAIGIGGNHADASASSGWDGSGLGTVGSEELVQLTDNFSDPLPVDFGLDVFFTSNLSSGGPAYSAQLSSSGGLMIWSGGTLLANPWVSVSGTTATGISESDSGGWSLFGGALTGGGFVAYNTVFQYLLYPGQTYDVGFYSQTSDMAQGVPTPPSGVVLSAGLVGLCLRRKRNAGYPK